MGLSTKTSSSGVKMAMTGKYLQVEELQQLQILDKNYTLNLDEVQLTITDDWYLMLCLVDAALSHTETDWKNSCFCLNLCLREDIWKDLGSSTVVHKASGFEIGRFFLNLKKSCCFYKYEGVNNWIIVCIIS